MAELKIPKWLVKKNCVKAITTRLKPNIYIDSHPYWERLKNGLSKMNIEEIDAFEALIMGKSIIHEQEKQQELF